QPPLFRLMSVRSESNARAISDQYASSPARSAGFFPSADFEAASRTRPASARKVGRKRAAQRPEPNRKRSRRRSSGMIIPLVRMGDSSSLVVFLAAPGGARLMGQFERHIRRGVVPASLVGTRRPGRRAPSAIMFGTWSGAAGGE